MRPFFTRSGSANAVWRACGALVSRRPVQLAFWLVLTVLPQQRAHAQAQVNNRAGPPDTAMNILFVHPTPGADGGSLYCAYPQAGCITFNRAACTSTVPIEMTFTRGAAGSNVTTANGTPTALGWVQNYGGSCRTPSISIAGGNLTQSTQVWGLTAGSLGQPARTQLPPRSVFLGGTDAINLPKTFESGLTLTVGQVMNAFPGVCDNPNGGITLSRFKLCVGLSSQNDGSINSSTVSNDPSTGGGSADGGDLAAGFEFPIDTVPPPAPLGVTTRSLVRRVGVRVDYDTTANDTYALNLRYTSDANDLARTDNGDSCATWERAATRLLIASTQSGNETADIPGDNMQVYGYCAQSVDYVGNTSDWTAAVKDMPHPECDLFECWPPDVSIDVGYCGSTLGAPWYAVCAAGLGFRLLRRRFFGKSRSRR